MYDKFYNFFKIRNYDQNNTISCDDINNIIFIDVNHNISLE